MSFSNRPYIKRWLLSAVITLPVAEPLLLISSPIFTPNTFQTTRGSSKKLKRYMYRWFQVSGLTCNQSLFYWSGVLSPCSSNASHPKHCGRDLHTQMSNKCQKYDFETIQNYEIIYQTTYPSHKIESKCSYKESTFLCTKNNTTFIPRYKTNRNL